MNRVSVPLTASVIVLVLVLICVVVVCVVLRYKSRRAWVEQR